MPKAVIFDVDGTLVDSNDLHTLAWQAAFQNAGFDLPFDRIRPQIGKGGDQLVPALLSPADDRKYRTTVVADRDRLFQRDYLRQVRPFPGVRELFRRCRDRGVDVVLGSSGKAKEVEHYAELLGIAELYRDHTTGDDAKKSKPEPDIFAAALKQLGSPRPEDVVVVGDSPYDAEAAGKLGLRTVGLLCGGFPEARLRAAGCMAIYRDPADLLARFDDSPLGGRPESAGLGEFAYWLAFAAGAAALALSVQASRKASAPGVLRVNAQSKHSGR